MHIHTNTCKCHCVEKGSMTLLHVESSSFEGILAIVVNYSIMMFNLFVHMHTVTLTH